MSTITQTVANFQYGAAQVTFNGVDLGLFKDAVTFTADNGYYEQVSSQSSMLLGKKLISERAVAVIAMQESVLDKITSICPHGTYVLDGSGSKKKIQFGGSQISTSDAKQLIITPTTDGSGTLTTDNNERVTIHLCLPEPKFAYQFSLENGEIVIPVEFHGIKDSTKDAGNQLYLLGDSTATA